MDGMQRGGCQLPVDSLPDYEPLENQLCHMTKCFEAILLCKLPFTNKLCKIKFASNFPGIAK